MRTTCSRSLPSSRTAVITLIITAAQCSTFICAYVHPSARRFNNATQILSTSPPLKSFQHRHHSHPFNIATTHTLSTSPPLTPFRHRHQSFLIKPVQRIPRYKLLLEELLKYTPSEPHAHPDHAAVQDAVKQVLTASSEINEVLGWHLSLVCVLPNLVNSKIDARLFRLYYPCLLSRHGITDPTCSRCASSKISTIFCGSRSIFSRCSV